MIQSLLSNNPKVQYLPVNTIGKDYVVGDIHGCIDLFNILLKEINFNKEIDRIISVGDLVDRGNNSANCLSLMLEPWFYAVMGNHEDLLRYSLLDLLALAGDDAEFDKAMISDNANLHVMNGGGWIRDFKTFDADYAKFWLPMINEMPLILVIGKDTVFRYNVVHSEIMSYGQHISDNLIDEHNYLLNAENLIWARNLFAQTPNDLGDSQTKEMSITFSGHTIQNKIAKRGRQINIDTCAFYSDFISKENNGTYGLTFVEPKSMIYTTVNGATHEITTGPV